MKDPRNHGWSNNNQTEDHLRTNGLQCTNVVLSTAGCEKPDIEAMQEKSEPSDAKGGLMKVLSRTISRISVNPGPPPDGGLQAWIQAFMGHLVVFNTWGYVNSFGVFQVGSHSVLQAPVLDSRWIDLLRYSLSSVAIRNFLDRLSPDISTLRNWVDFWTGYRRGVFQDNLRRRLNIAAARRFHDFFVHHVLAAVPSSGLVHWYRWWPAFLPCPRTDIDIFR